MDLISDRQIPLDTRERFMSKTINILDTHSFSFQTRNLIDVLPNLLNCPITEAKIAPITKEFLSKFCPSRYRHIALNAMN